MEKCENMTLPISFNSLKANPNVRVFVDILNNIESCYKVNASKYIKSTNTYFDKRKKNDDLLNCEGNKCRSKGSIVWNITTEVPTASETTQALFNAEEIYSGILTSTFTANQAGDYIVSYKISDYGDPTGENSSTWEKKVTVSDDMIGKPIQVEVNLTDIPTSVLPVGSIGWQPSQTGVTVEASVKKDGTATVADGTLSDIQFFRDSTDLIASETIILECVQTSEPDFGLDTTDVTCLSDMTYTDTNAKSLTIEYQKYTYNGLLLNPYTYRSSETTVTTYVPFERKIEEITIDGQKYGTIQLSDLDYNACDGFYAQLTGCDDSSSILHPLALMTATKVFDDQFIILKDEGANNIGRLLFSDSLVGETVIGYYPKEADVKEMYVFDNKQLNNPRLANVKVIYEQENSDSDVQFEMNRTLITAISGMFLPDRENEKNGSITFTPKNSSGQFARMAYLEK